MEKCICDTCCNFYQSQDLTIERCDFNSDLLSRQYFEKRINGDENDCVGFKSI